MWNKKIIKELTGNQIINDSKTPSGQVHVGSLRGVLIHDVIYRALIAKKINAKYIFGIDDFDPIDGLPADAPKWLEKYMGHPLFKVPAPENSPHSDMANHYIADFLNIFKELAVNAEIYRMRDIYQSGKFNDAIDKILSNADKVRQIYKKISNSIRPDNWHPFQVICENCGCLGSTEVSNYDGKLVTYHCKPDLVAWVKGCGNTGKVSPFNGNGKLVWKLEWVAKWAVLGITIEGAGKDHCTKGGSHDVASACLREIFNLTPPLNVPYEFFLVAGAKMSSSKGIGSSARNIADLLPAEMLRYLMTRTAPKKTVNFGADFEYIVKLYHEYDQLNLAYLNGKTSDDQQQILQMLRVSNSSNAYHPVGFQVLSAILQMPHLDAESAITKRSAGNLTALKLRIKSAKYWLDNFMLDNERVILQEYLPESANDLSSSQRAFLYILAGLIKDVKADESEYQRLIFSAARTTPLPQKDAFAAIYCVLLDKKQGPKGGALFSYLTFEFMQTRFTELVYDEVKFWLESGVDIETAELWLSKHQDNIISNANKLKFSEDNCFIELQIVLTDNKQHLLRIITKNETIATKWLANLECHNID